MARSNRHGARRSSQMGPPLVLHRATPSAAAGLTRKVYGTVSMDVHARVGQQSLQSTSSWSAQASAPSIVARAQETSTHILPTPSHSLAGLVALSMLPRASSSAHALPISRSQPIASSPSNTRLLTAQPEVSLATARAPHAGWPASSNAAKTARQPWH